jgi:hypothetical protein
MPETSFLRGRLIAVAVAAVVVIAGVVACLVWLKGSDYRVRVKELEQIAAMPLVEEEAAKPATGSRGEALPAPRTEEPAPGGGGLERLPAPAVE